MFHRDTWAEVSLGAIRHNVAQFRRFIAPQVRLMAVVKANGYGHGAAAAAGAALEAGADYLGVALLDEALELREAGIAAPILALGQIPARSLGPAIKAGVTITVFSRESAEQTVAIALERRMPVNVHLKLDTGMSRIGATSSEEAVAIAGLLAACPWIRLEGVFTHFADADGEDPAYTRMQFARFGQMIGELERAGCRFALKHICNSAGTMNYPDMHLDMVRIGIALYGLYPADALRNHPAIRLRQAFRLLTRISAVKRIGRLQPVGYGCASVAEEERTIAVLPAGYADGVSRLLSGRGATQIRGTTVPIVGRVCMDQTMIDVSAIPVCRPGEEAVLIGGDDAGLASIGEVARLMGSIAYEVVCLIGNRVPRIYV